MVVDTVMAVVVVQPQLHHRLLLYHYRCTEDGLYHRTDQQHQHRHHIDNNRVAVGIRCCSYPQHSRRTNYQDREEEERTDCCCHWLVMGSCIADDTAAADCIVGYTDTGDEPDLLLLLLLVMMIMVGMLV